MLTEENAMVQIFYKMLKSRLFEEKAMALKRRGYIASELFLSVGQESVCAAVEALGSDDSILASHRDLSVLLACDTDAEALFEELMEMEGGKCLGRSGQASYADNAANFYGACVPAGSCFAKALGVAISNRMQGKGNTVICFAGDGAAATGEFYEAVNQAVILKLPVIFFIENNCYSADMPVTFTSATRDISDRAKGFDIPGIIADGYHANEVYQAVKLANEYVKTHNQPTIVESKTYRLAGFDTSDEQGYRLKEEIEDFSQYDPIDILSEYMLDNEIGNYDDLLMLKDRAKEEIDKAYWTALNKKLSSLMKTEAAKR